jgi:hypothetical protein
VDNSFLKHFHHFLLVNHQKIARLLWLAYISRSVHIHDLFEMLIHLCDKEQLSRPKIKWNYFTLKIIYLFINRFTLLKCCKYKNGCFTHTRFGLTYNICIKNSLRNWFVLNYRIDKWFFTRTSLSLFI